jgi:methylenetetrahydrofolate dehydrogenase (NADP+)/methenyltetrahydrofolate cyclohydrolase
MDPRFIDGKAVASRIYDEVRYQFEALGGTSRKLVSISIGGDKEVAVYIRNQVRGAERAGIPFDDQYWDGSLTQEECKARIVAMNDDPDVIGIILQRPVPEHINVRSLQSAIHPLKDVEGMNPASIGNIVYNDLALAPCTAAASVELIKETGLKLEGLAEGATVTVCHHMTRSVAAHSRRADAVLVAVGIPNFLKADMVKPGAAVIDIGINQILDEKTGKSRIVGDVDTEKVIEVASWVTPVPGGVGPVTVSILMKNALTAHKRQLAAGWI